MDTPRFDRTRSLLLRTPGRRVELTVERLPEGEVSPYLTQELTIGDRLELRGPLGGWFVWRPRQTEAVQLIAGQFRHCSPHGDDSRACFGGQRCTLSIAVFGAGT